MSAEILAIDGPSGVGKSSVSTALSRRLGVPRLDTGAIYRAVTAAVLRAGVAPRDSEAVLEVARRATIEFDQDGTVTLDGEDVTDKIRDREVTAAVSAVSAHSGLRRVLVAKQREVADDGRWVVEGRDIGSVVFPNAALKVFLTASAAERARRRAEQTGETNLEAVKSDIERRDRLDSSRADSPLRPADDAVTVDTTEMSLDGVVDHVAALWERRHD